MSDVPTKALGDERAIKCRTINKQFNALAELKMDELARWRRAEMVVWTLSGKNCRSPGRFLIVRIFWTSD